MMRQALQQAWPRSGHVGTGPAIGGIEGAVPLNPGFTAVGTRLPNGGRSAPAIAWRQRAPRAPFRQRLAEWRARNWRRVVLAWFALSLIIVVLAAEPNTDFPKAQLRSVPAVQTFLRVAGGLTVAGVPVLLIALP